MRDQLHFLAKPGVQAQIVVGKGESAQGARGPAASGSCGKAEELLRTRRPVAQVVEMPAAVVADRLERQVIDLMRLQGDLRRGRRNAALTASASQST